jgi:hypothetical protein
MKRPLPPFQLPEEGTTWNYLSILKKQIIIQHTAFVKHMIDIDFPTIFDEVLPSNEEMKKEQIPNLPLLVDNYPITNDYNPLSSGWIINVCKLGPNQDLSLSDFPKKVIILSDIQRYFIYYHFFDEIDSSLSFNCCYQTIIPSNCIISLFYRANRFCLTKQNAESSNMKYMAIKANDAIDFIVSITNQIRTLIESYPQVDKCVLEQNIYSDVNFNERINNILYRKYRKDRSVSGLF